MRAPRAVVAVALVAGGIWLPAAAHPLDPVPHGVIGMGHEGYEITGVPHTHRDEEGRPVITIGVGERLTFQNDSRWIHVVGAGDQGHLTGPGTGAMTPRRLLEENATFTTGAWTTPGTYRITCSVHPEMNATVVVSTAHSLRGRLTGASLPLTGKEGWQ